jgi:hypothetical protein
MRAMEIVQNLHKTGVARTPVATSLTLLDGSATTTEAETTSALLHEFFPEDDTAQDSDHERNVRAQTASQRHTFFRQ